MNKKQTLSGARVLVTGGAGFIGSRLTAKLVEEGVLVHLLVRKETNLERIASLKNKVVLHFGDLRNAEDIRKIVGEINPSGIYHLATSTVMSGKTAPAKDVIETNVLGFVNLIEALSDVAYDFLINIGSFLEYAPKDRKVKETDEAQPPEIYSISKLAATLYGQAAANNTGKPVVTFRLFTPYGPGIQEGRLIRNLILKASEGADLELTERDVSRDFIYVGDIVSLLLEAADKARKYRGEIFNLGSGKSVTLEELVEKILRLTFSKSRAKWGARSTVVYDSKIWQADMAKTFKAFQFRPSISLEAGLKETIQWLKSANPEKT